MQNKHMHENCESQNHMLFDNIKMDLFLKDLNGDLHLLTYMDKI